jgi:transcriptional regulator
MTLYVPSAFRVSDTEAMTGFIERHAFGTLVSTGSQGLSVSHIPFVVDRRDDGSLRLLGHVARANPHWEALQEATQVIAIFQGPHAYVSPTWYANHPAVPTWNYAVVHAHGRASLLEEPELRELLERLSSKYESGRHNPWRLADAPARFVDGMVRAIVGFSIAVERLDGKFKLSQNRPAEIGRVIESLEREGEAGLAALMRAHSLQAKG